MLTATEYQAKADSITDLARRTPSMHDDLLVLAAQWCALVNVADWQDALTHSLRAETRLQPSAY